MPTSVIDGTIEDVEKGRTRGSITVFKSIRFRLDDGTERTLTKLVLKSPVTSELTPGASGRFYQFNAFDVRGIHGVRTASGRSVYAFPTNNQRLFLIVGAVSLLWLGFRLAYDGQVPLLSVGLLVLSVVGWFFMSKGQKDAKAQFEGDGGAPYPKAAADA